MVDVLDVRVPDPIEQFSREFEPTIVPYPESPTREVRRSNVMRILGPVLWGFEAFAGAPARAVGGALNAAVGGRPGRILDEAWESVAAPFTGADRIYPSSVVLRDWRPEGTAGKVGKFVAGAGIDILTDPLAAITAVARPFRFARLGANPFRASQASAIEDLLHFAPLSPSKASVPYLTRRGERVYEDLRKAIGDLIGDREGAAMSEWAASRAITRDLEPSWYEAVGDRIGISRIRTIRAQRGGASWEPAPAIVDDASKAFVERQLKIEGVADKIYRQVLREHGLDSMTPLERAREMFAPFMTQVRIPGVPELKFAPLMPLPFSITQAAAVLAGRKPVDATRAVREFVSDFLNRRTAWHGSALPNRAVEAWADVISRSSPVQVVVQAASGIASGFAKGFKSIFGGLRTAAASRIWDEIRTLKNHEISQMSEVLAQWNRKFESYYAGDPRKLEAAHLAVADIVEARRWMDDSILGHPVNRPLTSDEMRTIASRTPDREKAMLFRAAADVREINERIWKSEKAVFPAEMLRTREAYLHHVLRPELYPLFPMIEAAAENPQLLRAMRGIDSEILRALGDLGPLNPRALDVKISESQLGKVLDVKRAKGLANLNDLRNSLIKAGWRPDDVENITLFVANPFEATWERLMWSFRHRGRMAALGSLLDGTAYTSVPYGKAAEMLEGKTRTAEEAARDAVWIAGRYEKASGVPMAVVGWSPVLHAHEMEGLKAKGLVVISSQGLKGELPLEDIKALSSVMPLKGPVVVEARETGEEIVRQPARISGGKFFVVPEEIVNDVRKLQDYLIGSRKWGGHPAKPLFDRMDSFRRAILPFQTILSPFYHTRNIVDQMFISLLGHATPSDIFAASLLRIASHGGPERAAAIAGMIDWRGNYGRSFEELLPLFQRHVESMSFHRTEMRGGGIGGGLMEALRRQSDSLNAMATAMRENAISRAAGKVYSLFNKAGEILSDLTDSATRGALFLHGLSEGMIPADAAARARRLIYDYTELHPFEKQWIRPLFMFYTWTRKNIVQQIRNMYENPDYTRYFTRLTSDLIEANEYDNNALPRFISGGFGIPVGRTADGEVLYFVGRSWISMSDLAMMSNLLPAPGLGRMGWTPKPELAAMDVLSMLNPAIRMTLENLLNTSFRTFGPIYRGSAGRTKFLGIPVSEVGEYILRQVRILNDLDRMLDPEKYGKMPNNLTERYLLAFPVYRIDAERRAAYHRGALLDQLKYAQSAQRKIEKHWGESHPEALLQAMRVEDLRRQLSEIDRYSRRLKLVRPLIPDKALAVQWERIFHSWNRYINDPLVVRKSDEDFDSVVDAFFQYHQSASPEARP